jgi:NitT/TauT family transport system permease protein
MGWGAAASRLLRPLAVVALLLLAWEVGARLDPALASLLASPAAVGAALLTKWQVLLMHASITAYETIVGFCLALAGGLVSAVLLSLSPRLAAVMWPSILFAQITPKVALAPLLLVWLGFGALPKIIISFLIAFFPILANAYAGLRSLDEEVEELAASMRARGLRFFLQFQLPHALPRILGGARIAITFAVIGAVVGEFVGSDTGLGYLVILGARTLDSGLMVAAILCLGVLGVGLYGLIALAEGALIPWHIMRRRAEISEDALSRAASGSL